MARKQIDWEAIEKDYRLGQLSVRAIATKYEVSAAAISKKAKQKQWVRDASGEVRERTRAALITQPKQEEVNAEVNTVNSGVNTSTRNTPTQADIEVAVQTNIQVINRHRQDIGKGQRIVHLLMGELITGTERKDEIEDAIIDETAEDKGSQRRSKMLKAVSLPSRAATMRDLSTAMKNLVALERQAYNLDEEASEESLEDRLQRLGS